MKVRDLVKKFDELLAKFEQVSRERDDLKKRLAAAEAASKQAAPAESSAPADWKKSEEELLGKIKVLEKTKAGLQDKCISLEKERKAAVDKLQEVESRMQGEMQTLMNITRNDLPK